MLAVEKLHSVLLELQTLCKSFPLEKALSKLMKEGDASTAIDRLLCLIDDAVIEVEHCNFRKPGTQEKYLSSLSALRRSFFAGILVRDRSVTGPIMSAADLVGLEGMADAVSEKIEGSDQPMDRSAFADATEALRAEINGWDIAEYPKRALILSLQMLAHQSTSASYMASDQEIRKRVKSIVASFCVEFCELDKEFEGRFEKVLRWARLGYEGASTPLGLTYEGAKVAGLLPKP